MNTSHRGVRVYLAVILAMVAGVGFHQVQAQPSEDINAIFQMGKAAYYKGDLETAQTLLSQVAARDPRHFETKALLAQIRVQLKPGTSSIKKQYDGVMLANIEFADVTLQEALEGLRVMTNNKTDGKVVPNFIVKDTVAAGKPVSLRLSNLPLTQVIQYLADMTGCKIVYDKHAVIFEAS